MNAWLIAATILFVLLAACGLLCLLTGPVHGLVALELAGSLGTTLMLVLAEGYHRQPFAYIALVLAVLTFAGSLSFVRLLERGV